MIEPSDSTAGDHRVPASPLPGFESIKRYWDPRHRSFIAKISAGEYYVSTGPELIATVLGSCICACMRDERLRVGGMNHFMLPEDESAASEPQSCVDASLRYGSVAMESLINALLVQGARRERLEIKIFGGGRAISSRDGIGQRNVDFVLDYLHTEGYSVASKSVGGSSARKVVYDPTTGKALVKLIRTDEQEAIRRLELGYVKTLAGPAVSGDVELF